ncbi:MAG: hypothetical protein M1836_000014 [Candelina mexicana]|nr:MAG: hypothetical protein M1836_000014 [Candelina mexicana]
MASLSATRTILILLFLSTTPSLLALPTTSAPNPIPDTQQPIFEPPPTHPWSFWLYANPHCNTDHSNPSPLPVTTALDPHAFSTHAGHDNRRCEKVNLGVPALGWKTTSGGSGITGEGIAPCIVRFYNDAECKEGNQVGTLALASSCQQPKRKATLEDKGKDEVLAFSVHC